MDGELGWILGGDWILGGGWIVGGPDTLIAETRHDIVKPYNLSCVIQVLRAHTFWAKSILGMMFYSNNTSAISNISYFG